MKDGIINSHFQLDKEEYIKRLKDLYPLSEQIKKDSTKNFRVIGLLSSYYLTNEIFFFALTATILINKFWFDLYGDENDVMNLIIVTRLVIMILFSMRIYISDKANIKSLIAFMLDVILNIISLSLGFYAFTLKNKLQPENTFNKVNLSDEEIKVMT